MKRRGRDCRFGVVSMCIGEFFSSIVVKEYCFSNFLFLLPRYVLERSLKVGIVCYYYYYNTGTGMGAAAVFERGDSCDELCNARKVDH